MFKFHGYSAPDAISATVDGILYEAIPINSENPVWLRIEASGNTIPPYVPPEAVAPILTPALYAVAALTITPGDIGGIDTSVNFAAALYMDIGSYLLFFTEAQENTNYLAKAYDDETRVRVTEKGLDYIVVTVTDSDGNPADPAEISVEIIRVA